MPQGPFVKLYHKEIPMRIWHFLWNWYNTSCSVTWHHAISTSFPSHQGVRQGAILSHYSTTSTQESRLWWSSENPSKFLPELVSREWRSGMTYTTWGFSEWFPSATWKDHVDKLCLPSIQLLFKSSHQKESWKRYQAPAPYISMQHQCENYHLGDCALLIGRPASHWAITLHDTYATRKYNFRIRLFTPCDGLEDDASCFRSRNNHSQLNNPIASSATLNPNTTSTSLPSALPSHLSDPVSWATSLLK